MFNRKYLGLGFLAAIVIVLIVSCASMASACTKPIPRDPDLGPVCHAVKHPKKFQKRHPNAVLFKGYLICHVNPKGI